MPGVETSVPVLIMPAERHGALGIARTLGRLGAPVYGYGRGISAICASRYLKRRFPAAPEDAPPARVVERLIEIARMLGGRAVLIPTCDETAVLIARYSAALKPWFIFPEQDAETIATLCSKKRMHSLAKRAGVPTPDACFPESGADLMRFLQSARFPVMLKGIDGRSLQRRCGKRMHLVGAAEELLRLYHELEDPQAPNLMVQEYIPVADDTLWMFNGYFDRNGHCAAAFAGRKLHQFPVGRGLTCLGVSQANSEVTAAACKLLSAAGYRGAVDIDFLFDRRDGLYKVIDVNPRVGATFRLFVDSQGMDVVRSLYLDLTGQAHNAAQGAEGRSWLVEDIFTAAYLGYLTSGRLRGCNLVKELHDVSELAYFDRFDPLPFAALGLEDACKGAAALMRRIRRGFPARTHSTVLTSVSN